MTNIQKELCELVFEATEKLKKMLIHQIWVNGDLSSGSGGFKAKIGNDIYTIEYKIIKEGEE